MALSDETDAVASPGDPALEAVFRALDRTTIDDPRARLDALCLLSEWLDSDDGSWFDLVSDENAGSRGRSGRIDALTTVLRERADTAVVLGDFTAALLTQMKAAEFLARVGVASETRLLSEIGNRLARKLLPTVDDGIDAGSIVDALFVQRGVLAATDASLLALVELLLQRSPSLREGLTCLEGEVVDAATIVGLRLLQLSVVEDVRARAPTQRLTESPFVRLARATDALVRAGTDERGSAAAAVAAAIGPASIEIAAVREGLETGSVSADLVFRIDVIERLLARLTLLVNLLAPSDGRFGRALAALRIFVDARTTDTTLRGLVRESSRLLARRIVETSGRSGEHYIASTTTEYRHMWWSAAGGGAVMAFVAPLKFLLGWLKLPLFFAGLAAGLNYAVAFVVLQVFGLTLATKQPSMTAAALAAAVDSDRDDARRQQLVALIARTVRTQLAAIIGNLGVIVPVSVALHFVLLATLDRPFLDPTYATRVLGAHHLLASGSVLFAALTGVWLWTSSMVGSWFDNWLRHRRVPDGLRSSRRIRRLIGVARSVKLAAIVDRSAGAFVANVTIGLLLGLTPAVAGFFGMPLDIRHITISTASVTLATLTLGVSGVHVDTILWAVAGLAAIAVMNFAVSFALALGVALRALDIDATVLRTLIPEVLVELRTRPLSFIVPPRDS